MRDRFLHRQGQKLFRSRVARRVFVLFVVSALVPLCLLGTIAYYQAGRQMERQTQDHMRRENKAQAVALYERLLAVDDTVAAIAQAVNGAPAVARSALPPALAAAVGDLAGSRLGRVSLQRADGSVDALVGAPLEPFVGSRRAREHLAAGATFLRTVASEERAAVHAVRRVGGHDALVLTEVAADFLWRFELDAGQMLCVIGEQGTPLSCPRGLLQRVRAPLLDALGTAITGPFDGRGVADGIDGHYKALFLGARFAAPSWVVLSASADGPGSAAGLRLPHVFPWILLLSLLLVVLLSLIQIRRFTLPLERLRDATRRLAAQDFSTPVVVESGDEFEQLADSFNRMTLSLEEMFATLERFSEIDAVILTAPDRSKVLDTVAAQLREMLHCDAAALVSLPLRGTAGEVRIVRPPAPFDPEHDVRILDPATESFARARAHVEVIERTDALPAALAPLAAVAPGQVLWVPVQAGGQLAGALCCAWVDGDAADARRRVRAKDLSHRLAVALADAIKSEALNRQAHYDALTGLPNRHVLDARLRAALAEADATGCRVGLLFLDLDSFKAINDSLGHTVGDRFLQHISERLASHVREGETVARFGGDEFVVIMPGLGDDFEERVKLTSRHLTAAVSEPCHVDGREITTSTSVGVSVYPRDASTPEDLLKRADIALYHVKKLGKDNFQLYSPALMEHGGRQLEIESALREALVGDRLELHYQPQLDLQTGRVHGAEALLRWPQCPLGDLRTDQFIAVAEESRLIKEIGGWVLRRACAQAREWREAGMRGFKIAVNVSPRQFRDEDLPSLVAAALEENGLAPEALEIEVTESVLMDDIDKASLALKRLRSLGVTVAIDDFGTGHSSLEYLAHLPVSALKIDRSFVSRATSDHAAEVIVETVIQLAHRLGMQVIAEGAETPDQVRLMRRAGCDVLQGYHYATPMSARELMEWHRLRPVELPGRVASVG